MKLPLLCNICKGNFHHTWLGSWNEWNWEKYPMHHDNFVCLSCIANPKTREQAHKINGWEWPRV